MPSLGMVGDPANQGVVGAGQSASNVATGTPEQANNTGRDWGQAGMLGLSTLGAVVGSILTWGAASPALIALDAAAIGTTAANDAIQDKSQDAAQQRQQQANLDSQMQKQGQPSVTMPNANANPVNTGKTVGGGGVQSAKTPIPGASVGTVGPAVKPTTYQSFTPDQVSQPTEAAQPMSYQTDNQGMSITSDRRAKTNIQSGKLAVSEFLDKVRQAKAWPKSIKDPML